jgi:hypothetical protein
MIALNNEPEACWQNSFLEILPEIKRRLRLAFCRLTHGARKKQMEGVCCNTANDLVQRHLIRGLRSKFSANLRHNILKRLGFSGLLCGLAACECTPSKVLLHAMNTCLTSALYLAIEGDHSL